MTLVDGIGTYGGGEILAREVAKRLDPARFASTLCVSRWEPEWSSREHEARLLAELDEAGVRFVGLERRGRPALRPWGRLVRLMREQRVDVLHTHKFGSNAWGVPIHALGGARAFVAHEHTWSFEGGGMRKLIDRELISRAAGMMIAVSSEDRRRMIAVEGIRPERVTLIPNGIAAPPTADGKRLRAELGIGTRQPVIGTVLTLHRYKAVDVLIEAASLLRERFPDLRVLVAGPASDQHPDHIEELRTMIAALDLEGTVSLLGHREDAAAVIAALDVAICPSDQEGSPLAVLEYMEAARPVVGTAVGGVPDQIADGETGYLVPPRDPGAMAERVAGLLADPALAERMGESGRSRRRERFDVSATTRQIEDLYVSLLGAG